MAKAVVSAVDLFCGVGGLTHGLERAGVRVAAGVDIEEACRTPYEANNKARFIAADVASIEPDYINSLFKPARFKLLAGCAPCQPFSTYSRAGRGKKYHEQWPLLSSFASLVSDIKPDFVTMENVPQVLNHPVFSDFCSSLSDYMVWFDVVDCALYGVPQTRKRLVLLASRHGNLRLNPTHSVAATVRDTIACLPELTAGGSDSSDPLHTAARLSELNLARIRASVPGGTWRDWPQELLAECHRRDTGATYPAVYGRMEWERPAPTMTTQCFGFGNGRFGHPSQDRAISLREAAMLQTFPRDYQFLFDSEPVVFSRLGRLIGNAVPVRIGEVIGDAVFNHAKSIAA
ncbi:DNA cytosine methyltransferase [Stenotrophomonas muris]|uniref:DNA cytosine methyltransferase n=1 Tax=Stenotrophomonas muris TaxID=2963283 RepID=UPI002E795711|nr:DNA cytosine methyltransferase [Stenotrophomonas muris]